MSNSPTDARFPHAPLRGIVVPLVTPLRAADELDVEGLPRLLDRVVSGGVAGVFLLGTCGEGPTLSYRTRYQCVEESGKHLQGRATLFVGITDTSFRESVDLARFAEESGADAVVAAPPYYLPLTSGELIDYYRRLADESALPVIVYNMPSCTHVSISTDVIAAVADHPRIAGIKDSSGQLDVFQQYLTFREARPDWTILIGPEHLTAEAIRLGGHGGVNGGANVAPALFVETAAAAFAGNADRVTELQHRINDLAAIYEHGTGATAVIRGLKAALQELGVCQGELSEPLRPCTAADIVQVRTVLAKLGLVASSVAAEVD